MKSQTSQVARSCRIREWAAMYSGLISIVYQTDAQRKLI